MIAPRSGTAREGRTAWLLALPAVLLMAVFLIGPTFAVFGVSLTDWANGPSAITYAGLANYRTMLADPVFWQSLHNTVFYVAVTVPVSIALGLLVSLAIEAGDSFRRFYRTIHLLPVLATMSAMALAWEVVLNPTIGLVNQLLALAGFAGENWLRDPHLVLPVFCVIGIWSNLGFAMIFFLAGLGSIPRELYEAAAVDGADGVWDRFITVTWPALGPVTLFITVLSAVRAFNVFDQIAILTQGGPDHASEMLLYTIFQAGFTFLQPGYGSAVSVALLAIVGGLTFLQARIGARRVHY